MDVFMPEFPKESQRKFFVIRNLMCLSFSHFVWVVVHLFYVVNKTMCNKNNLLYNLLLFLFYTKHFKLIYCMWEADSHVHYEHFLVKVKVKSVANNKKRPYNTLYLELGEMPHFPNLTSIQDFVNSKIKD